VFLSGSSALAFNAGSPLSPSAAALPFAGASFSVALWLKRTGGYASNATLFSAGVADPDPAVAAAASTLLLAFTPTGDLRVSFAYGSTDLIVAASKLPLSKNTWMHVLLSFDVAAVGGMQRTLFVNGMPLGWDYISAPLQVDQSTAVLGARYVGATLTDYFVGSIDELFVFSTALGSDSVLCLLATGAVNEITAGVQMHVRFFEQDAAAATDSSPAGRNLLSVGPSLFQWERTLVTPVLPMCFQNSSSCSLRSRALYRLDMRRDTMVHASRSLGWSGNARASGFAEMNAVSMLDLQNLQDNGLNPALMPTTGLGPDLTLASWLRFTAPTTHTGGLIFGCASGVAGSGVNAVDTDLISFGQKGSTALLEVILRNSTGGVVCQCASTNVQLLAGVFQHVAVVFSSSGAGSPVTFFVNGVAEACSTAASTCPFSKVVDALNVATERTKCFMGQLPSNSTRGHWVGSAASLDVYPFALTSSEVASMGISPPASLAPAPLSLIDVPAFLAPGATSSSIGIPQSIVFSVPFTLGVTSNGASVSPISAAGTFVVSPSSFTVPAVPTFTLSFPTEASVSVSIAPGGAGGVPIAGYLLATRTVTIANQTLANLYGSAALNIRTDSQGINAGWAAGAAGGTGVVVFNSANHWLDLTNDQDTRVPGGVLPQFGGDYTAMTLSMWLYWDVATAAAGDTAVFFCAGPSSIAAATADSITLSYGTVSSTRQLMVTTYKAATPSTFASGLTPPVRQWVHIAFVLNSFGAGQLFVGGVGGTPNQLTAANMPPLRAVPRSFAALGKGVSGIRFNGRIAAFTYFARPLLPDEVMTLASNPPPSVRGSLTIIGFPQVAANPSTLAGLTLATDLVLGSAVTVTIRTTNGGTSTPVPGLVLGGAQKGVTITFGFNLPALADSDQGWTLSISVTGAQAGYYTAPASFTIMRPTSTTADEAVFYSLSTTSPNAHAGVEILPSGMKVATFDGTTTPGAGQYLDLSQPIADIGNASPIGDFGGSAASPEAFSICAWVRQDAGCMGSTSAVTPAYQYTVFSCAPSAGDNTDSIYFGTQGFPRVVFPATVQYNSWVLQFNGATTTGPLLKGGPDPPCTVSQWQHVCVSVTSLGQATLYLGGVGYSMGTSATLPNLRTRSSCRIGSDAVGSRALKGAVAQLQYFRRALLDQEVLGLAAAVPVQLRSAPFLVLGVPSVAAASSSVRPLSVKASLLTSLQVTLSINVTLGGFVTPADLVYQSTGAGGVINGDFEGTYILALSLPALPANALDATSWTVSFSLSGPGASFYTAPDPIMIVVESYPVTLATALWKSTLGERSVNAGFQPVSNGVPNAPAGYATFDGTKYIDLTYPLDVGSAGTMPAFGTATLAKPRGWTACFWARQDAKTNVGDVYEYTWFSCSGDNGEDLIYASTVGNLHLNSFEPPTGNLVRISTTQGSNPGVDVPRLAVGTGAPLIQSQFTHLCFMQDEWGNTSAWRNGLRFAGGNVGTPQSLPLKRARTSCRLGQDRTGALGFVGAMASFMLWDRALNVGEVANLASDPPGSIRAAAFTVTGVPVVAPAVSPFSPVTIFSPLSTYLTATLVARLTIGGSTSPAPLSWGQSLFNAYTLTLSFPALTAGATGWVLSFEMTGPGAGFYAAPRNYTIVAESAAADLAGPVFAMDFSTPSDNAQWVSVPSSGGGYAVFTGTEFLDLNYAGDVGAAGTFPLVGGDALENKGWSACFWARQDAKTTMGDVYDYAWFSCSADKNDESDLFYMGSRGFIKRTAPDPPTSNMLRMRTSKGSVAGISDIAGPSTNSILLSNQWGHLCVSIDNLGNAAGYKNGIKYPITGQNTNLPLRRQRKQCKIGTSASNTDNFVGAMASFAFWERSLSLAEVRVLASNPPLSIRRAPLTIQNFPTLAANPSIAANIQIYPTLLTYLPVVISGTILEGGNMVQNDVSFSQNTGAAVVVSFVLPLLATNQSSWTIQFTLSGAGAGFYTVQGGATKAIQAQTYEWTLATASFTLNLATRSASAQWRPASNGAAQGTAVFTGASATGNTYLDLNQPTDTNTITMPDFGGTAAEPAAFSFHMWLQPSSTYPLYQTASFVTSWFSCGASSSSGVDSIGIITQSRNTNPTFAHRLIYQQQVGSNAVESSINNVLDQSAQLGVWTSVGVTQDVFGTTIIYIAGKPYSLGLFRTQQRVRRLYCRLGENAGANPNPTAAAGEIAGFRMWNRALVADEMVQLASQPPAALVPAPFAIRSMTRSAAPGATIPPITISINLRVPSLVLSASLTQNLGIATPASMDFSYPNAASTSLQLTFPTTGTNTGMDWLLSFGLTGGAASAFAAPSAVTIYQPSVAALQSSTVFVLNASVPSLHAHWSPPSELAKSGIVDFNRNGYVGDYLDLMNILDSPCGLPASRASECGTLMPSVWPSGTEGFTIAAWLYWSAQTVPVNDNVRFLTCSASLGSVNDAIWFGTRGGTQQLIIQWYSGATLVTPFSIFSTGTIPFQSWVQVAVTVTDAGLVSYYINGQPSGTSQLAGRNADLPKAVTRSVCSAGRGYDPTQTNGVFQGSISQLQYYSRALLREETLILGANNPNNNAPRYMVLSGTPGFAAPGAQYTRLLLTPASCATGVVNVAITVSPAGSAQPSTLTFDTSAGTCKGQYFALTTGPAANGPPEWKVSFALSGSDKDKYILLPVTIPAVGQAVVQASASFYVNTNIQSVHAGVAAAAGADPSTQIVTFNGLTQYLDLALPADTGYPTAFTPNLVVANASPNSSYSFAAWVRWAGASSGTSPSSAKLLSCSTPFSPSEEIFLSQSGTTDKMLYGHRSGGSLDCNVVWTADSMPVGQFFHMVLVFNGAERTNNVMGFIHGDMVLNASCPLPNAVARPSCSLARSAIDGSAPWPGALASFHYFARALSAPEISVLASNPPANIRPVIIVQGLPVFAVPGASIPGVRVSLSACLGQALAVTLRPVLTVVAPAGNPAVNGTVLFPVLAFAAAPGLSSSCAPQSFTVDLPADTSVNTWVLRWEMTGPGMTAFVPPPEFVIRRLTVEAVKASATFTLSTSTPSLHAGWIEGAAPGSGVAVFNSSAYYLDLRTVADTRVSPPFPNVFGGAPGTVTTSSDASSALSQAQAGWALDFIIQWQPALSQNAVLFQCTLNAASPWDSFALVQDGSTSSVKFRMNLASTAQADSPSWPLKSSTDWQHVLLRQDSFGMVQLWVQGVAVGAPFASSFPLRAARNSCAVGRPSWNFVLDTTSTTYLRANLASMRYFAHAPSDDEVALLAQEVSFPSSIVPGIVRFVAPPSAALAGRTISIKVAPSTSWATPLGLSVAVSGGGSITAGSALTFPAALGSTTVASPQSFTFLAPSGPGVEGTQVTFTVSSDSPVRFPDATLVLTIQSGSITVEPPVGALAVLGQKAVLTVTSNVGQSSSVSLRVRSLNASSLVSIDGTGLVNLGGSNPATAQFVVDTAPGVSGGLASGDMLDFGFEVSGADAALFPAPPNVRLMVIAPGQVVPCLPFPTGGMRAGSMQSLCFKLTQSPLPVDSAEVRLVLSLTGGGALNKYAIVFTAANWNVGQNVVLVAPPAAGFLSLSATIDGSSANAFSLGWANPVSMSVLATINVVAPSTLRVGSTSGAIRVSLAGFGSFEANMCAHVVAQATGAGTGSASVGTFNGLSEGESICFNAGATSFTYTAPSVAQSVTVTITPSAGTDALLFAPSTSFNLQVQAYVRVVSVATGSNTVAVPPGAEVALSVFPVGLPPLAVGATALDTLLQVVFSADHTGAFSSTLLSFTDPSSTTGAKSITYKDASGATSGSGVIVVTLSTLALGGSNVSLVSGATEAAFTLSVSPDNAPLPSTPAPPTTGGGGSGSGGSDNTGGGSGSGGTGSGGTGGGSGSGGSGSGSGGCTGTGCSGSGGSGSGGGNGIYVPPTDDTSDPEPTKPTIPISGSLIPQTCGTQALPCALDKPVAVLLVPNFVSRCTEATLDGRASYRLGALADAPAGGFWHWRTSRALWQGVDLLALNGTAAPVGAPALNISWVSALGSGFGSASSAYTDKRVVVVPGSQMVSGVSYEFELVVANKMYSSAPVTVLMTLTDNPAPVTWLPQMTLRPPSVVTRAATNDFVLDLLAGCDGAALPMDVKVDYKWRVQDAIDGSTVSITTASTTAPLLSLPPHTLQAEREYNVSVVVTFTPTGATLGGTQVQSATRVVKVARSTLVARIVGADRTRSVADSTILDGTASFDPDVPTGQTQQLRYLWTCRIGTVPCTQWPPLSPLQLQQSQLQLDEYSMQANAHYTFTLTVSSAAGGVGDTRVATAAVTIDTLAVAGNSAFAPLVSIVNAPVSTSPIDAASPLALTAVFASRSNTAVSQLTVTWTCSDAKALSGLAVTGSELLVPAGRFLPGGAYTLRVEVADIYTDTKGVASVSFNVGLPPTGGACSVAPIMGLALQEDFVVNCKDWYSPVTAAAGVTGNSDGEHEPLRYSIVALTLDTAASGIKVPAIDVTPVSLLADGDKGAFAPVNTLRLPEGTYALRITVSDSSGAQLRTVQELAVRTSSDPNIRIQGAACYALQARQTQLIASQNAKQYVRTLLLIKQLGDLLGQSAAVTSIDSLASCSASLPTGVNTLPQLRQHLTRLLAQSVVQLVQSNELPARSYAAARLLISALKSLGGDSASFAAVVAADGALKTQLLQLVHSTVDSVRLAQFAASSNGRNQDRHSFVDGGAASISPALSATGSNEVTSTERLFVSSPAQLSSLLNSAADVLNLLLQSCGDVTAVVSTMHLVLASQARLAAAPALAVNTAVASSDSSVLAFVARAQMGFAMAPYTTASASSSAALKTLIKPAAPTQASTLLTATHASVQITARTLAALQPPTPAAAAVLDAIDTSAGFARFGGVDVMAVGLPNFFANCAAFAPPTTSGTTAPAPAGATIIISPTLSVAVQKHSSLETVAVASRSLRAIAPHADAGGALVPSTRSKAAVSANPVSVLSVHVPVDPALALIAAVEQLVPLRCFDPPLTHEQLTSYYGLSCAWFDATAGTWVKDSSCRMRSLLPDMTVQCDCSVASLSGVPGLGVPFDLAPTAVSISYTPLPAQRSGPTCFNTTEQIGDLIGGWIDDNGGSGTGGGGGSLPNLGDILTNNPNISDLITAIVNQDNKTGLFNPGMIGVGVNPPPLLEPVSVSIRTEACESRWPYLFLMTLFGSVSIAAAVEICRLARTLSAVSPIRGGVLNLLLASLSLTACFRAAPSMVLLYLECDPGTSGILSNAGLATLTATPHVANTWLLALFVALLVVAAEAVERRHLRDSYKARLARRKLGGRKASGAGADEEDEEDAESEDAESAEAKKQPGKGEHYRITRSMDVQEEGGDRDGATVPETKNIIAPPSPQRKFFARKQSSASAVAPSSSTSNLLRTNTGAVVQVRRKSSDLTAARSGSSSNLIPKKAEPSGAWFSVATLRAFSPARAPFIETLKMILWSLLVFTAVLVILVLLLLSAGNDDSTQQNLYYAALVILMCIGASAALGKLLWVLRTGLRAVTPELTRKAKAHSRLISVATAAAHPQSDEWHVAEVRNLLHYQSLLTAVRILVPLLLTFVIVTLMLLVSAATKLSDLTPPFFPWNMQASYMLHAFEFIFYCVLLFAIESAAVSAADDGTENEDDLSQLLHQQRAAREEHEQQQQQQASLKRARSLRHARTSSLTDDEEGRAKLKRNATVAGSIEPSGTRSAAPSVSPIIVPVSAPAPPPVIEEASAADPTRAHQWLLMDDVSAAAPPAPGLIIKEVEQFQENGLPFNPRFFRKYVLKQDDATGSPVLSPLPLSPALSPASPKVAPASPSSGSMSPAPAPLPSPSRLAVPSAIRPSPAAMMQANAAAAASAADADATSPQQLPAQAVRVPSQLRLLRQKTRPKVPSTLRQSSNAMGSPSLTASSPPLVAASPPLVATSSPSVGPVLAPVPEPSDDNIRHIGLGSLDVGSEVLVEKPLPSPSKKKEGRTSGSSSSSSSSGNGDDRGDMYSAGGVFMSPLLLPGQSDSDGAGLAMPTLEPSVMQGSAAASEDAPLTTAGLGDRAANAALAVSEPQPGESEITVSRSASAKKAEESVEVEHEDSIPTSAAPAPVASPGAPPAQAPVADVVPPLQIDSSSDDGGDEGDDSAAPSRWTVIDGVRVRLPKDPARAALAIAAAKEKQAQRGPGAAVFVTMGAAAAVVDARPTTSQGRPARDIVDAEVVGSLFGIGRAPTVDTAAASSPPPNPVASPTHGRRSGIPRSGASPSPLLSPSAAPLAASIATRVVTPQRAALAMARAQAVSRRTGSVGAAAMQPDTPPDSAAKPPRAFGSSSRK